MRIIAYDVLIDFMERANKIIHAVRATFLAARRNTAQANYKRINFLQVTTALKSQGNITTLSKSLFDICTKLIAHAQCCFIFLLRFDAKMNESVKI